VFADSQSTRPRSQTESGGAIMLKTTTLPAGVALSNPDRVLYPDQQLTKRDLATYYLAVADTILPYIKDRPLMVVRCPRGRQKQCFHQKHVNESIPEPIRSIEVEEQKGVHPCIAVSDTAGLIMLVQLARIIHWVGVKEASIRSKY
jgi:bifunctional non-homologous end joining protein LigD